MSKTKKLFIFDLDGVLVDACEWHHDALNEALREVCGFEISREEHVSTFNGIPTAKKLDILTNQGRVKKQKHSAIYSLKQQKTIILINERAYKRPEKIEMIEVLRSRGHKVCCYTNSIRETAEMMLKKSGVYEMFDLVLTNQDVQNPKPDPEGYERIIKEMDIDRSMTYIIEDSPRGIQAAKESGANVIEVGGPDEVNINLLRAMI